jgi:hypothetical protein
MRLPLLFALALILSACAPGAAPDAPASGANAEADCAARGGEMRRVGRLQTLQCVVRYSDAGRRCTSGDGCQGDCRLPEGAATPPALGASVAGVCQANSDRFGCYTRVENGRAEPTICVD